MCFSIVSSFLSSFNFSSTQFPFLFSHFANCTISLSVSARCMYEGMFKFYIEPFSWPFSNRLVYRWWCGVHAHVYAHVNFPNLHNFSDKSRLSPSHTVREHCPLLSNVVALKLLFVSFFRWNLCELWYFLLNQECCERFLLAINFRRGRVVLGNVTACVDAFSN